jgi:oligopeptidase A
MTDVASSATNPLLDEGPVLDFSAVRPEHVTPAIDVLLAQAQAAREAAVQPTVAPEYLALSRALDVPVERLQRAWAVASHLQEVADSPAMRAAYGDNLGRVTDFFTALGADERLYTKIKTMAAGPDAARWTPAQRKVVGDSLRDFVLGGAELVGEAKTRFAALQTRMAELSQAFAEHLLDATDAYALTVPAERLKGLPGDVLAAAIEAARSAGDADGQARLTLHDPCFRPALRFVDDRDIRRTLYLAHAQRASEFGPPEQDNGPVMRELVALRQEAAALLGHPSYAHLSLVPKMAESPAQVEGFIRDLAGRARPFAERDLDDLKTFAREYLGLSPLEAWDIPWASERLSQHRYAFSSDEVKRYFPEHRVLGGLFQVVQSLFDVAIVPHAAPVWHPDVQVFRVARQGQPLGVFYVDLHARSGKHAGAWMNSARQRWRRPDSGALQLPVAYLVCNFAAPVGTQPALLTHDDVITLFHEVGHGLHHLLTQVDEAAVSGLAGVEWDAAELPSQFMENFCWEWEVLQQLSAHVDTGEPLPRSLFDRMRAARNFQSGLQMLRHCEFSLFDMRLHHEPGVHADIQALAQAVREEVAVLFPPPTQRFANSFSHLFDGGYAAGYYGYAWAEVLSADAYAAFEESGVLNPATGRRFREAILETGGSRPAAENFRAFRGRDPQIDALLRHQGMAVA